MLTGAIGAAAGAATFTLARALATAIPAASNPALRRTMEALYRVGDQVSGGIAEAIRYEARTGHPIRGRFHLQKGIDRMRNLENILQRERLSRRDRALAERQLRKLKDAIEWANDFARRAAR